MGKSSTFQIKSLKGEPHLCPRSFTNKSVNSSYLAEQYVDTFMEVPSLPIRSFKTLVRKDVKVYAHRQKLYRAKKKAIEKIQGNVHEQYARIRQYCHQILKTNPGSSAILRTEGPPLYRFHRFQRIFVFFEAQKRGFKEGCRPVIGLDACFLKGPFGGQLMAAIGRDGNNQMFPLAIAVVESECKQSWGWFLNLLVASFGNMDIAECSFISDRQKGLLESFQTILPNSEHRFCVRHMYANFKLRFKDKILKDLMWGAATSYLEDGFNLKMNEIREISVEAYEWLKNIPSTQWCKHKISSVPKCDMLSNNLCESFNNYIKEARDMPILTMLEALRRQFMCRIQEKREWIQKCKGKICPRIQEKLNEIKHKALDFECFLAAEGLWEVTLGNKSWAVNLKNHTCTCREWNLTGIPCVHATCTLLMQQKMPEDYVSHYYSVEMYKKAYSYIIQPVPDHSQWESGAPNETQLILPPVFKKQPGRPKKLRRKGKDEINVDGKVTRRGIAQTCSNCGDSTHNVRKCKRPPSDNPKPKRTKKVKSAPTKSRMTTHEGNVQPNSTAPIILNKVTQTSQGFTAAVGVSTQVSSTGATNSNKNGARGTVKRGRGRKSAMLGAGNWNGVRNFRPPTQVPLPRHEERLLPGD